MPETLKEVPDLDKQDKVPKKEGSKERQQKAKKRLESLTKMFVASTSDDDIEEPEEIND